MIGPAAQANGGEWPSTGQLRTDFVPLTSGDYLGHRIRYAEEELPIIAELGYRVLRVVAWHTDAEHAPEDYLEGSSSFGSGNAPWELEISRALGGEDALRHLVDRAHELGVEIVLWTSPGHLSNSSPLLVENPDWIMWKADGRPEDAGYGDVVGTSLNAGYLDYALDRYAGIRQATGVDGFLVDSYLTFGLMTDHARPQPTPQLDLTVETQQHWAAMGYGNVILEGCGPLGISSGGVPSYPDLDPEVPPEQQAEARRRIRRVIGREYGFYRYVLETVMEPDSYYRALASGAHVTPQFLHYLAGHPEEEIELVKRTNYEYLEASEHMDRRRLLAEGETWKGVEWTSEEPGVQVVFAFDSMLHPVRGATLLRDLTSGGTAIVEEGFETEPRHTYLLRSLVRPGS